MKEKLQQLEASKNKIIQDFTRVHHELIVELYKYEYMSVEMYEMFTNRLQEKIDAVEVQYEKQLKEIEEDY